MRNPSFKWLLLLAGVAFVALAACDTVGEQHVTWEPGTALRIEGSSEIATGTTNQYYVDGHTIEENYTWAVDGEVVTEDGETAWLVDRGEATGEFIAVTFDSTAAGAHTITVTNGQYEGSLDVMAVIPTE